MRASVGAKGGPANGPSSDPFLSAGGRYVVFTSEASNLVAGDTNGVADVFRRDLKLTRPSWCRARTTTSWATPRRVRRRCRPTDA